MAFIGDENNPGILRTLPPNRQCNPVREIIDLVLINLEPQQASLLYDTLAALIRQWPIALQSQAWRDLSGSALLSLPVERAAGHDEILLDIIKTLPQRYYDLIMNCLAIYFYCLPAEDNLALFQRMVELSRFCSPPYRYRLIERLAQNIHHLPAGVRSFGTQILTGCGFLTEEERESLSRCCNWRDRA